MSPVITEAAGDQSAFSVVTPRRNKVMAADVSDGLEAETLQGGKATFSVDGNGAMVEGAAIVTTDIETSNGVIHVIDAVILPPGM